MPRATRALLYAARCALLLPDFRRQRADAAAAAARFAPCYATPMRGITPPARAERRCEALRTPREARRAPRDDSFQFSPDAAILLPPRHYAMTRYGSVTRDAAMPLLRHAIDAYYYFIAFDYEFCIISRYAGRY